MPLALTLVRNVNFRGKAHRNPWALATHHRRPISRSAGCVHHPVEVWCFGGDEHPQDVTTVAEWGGVWRETETTRRSAFLETPTGWDGFVCMQIHNRVCDILRTRGVFRSNKLSAIIRDPLWVWFWFAPSLSLRRCSSSSSSSSSFSFLPCRWRGPSRALSSWPRSCRPQRSRSAAYYAP